MAAFLIFTLYAPLGAFGDIAVGERRGGFDRPGRSAVLGLLAAALGIDRRDEEGHRALDRAFALALRVERVGDLLQDYHTVQAPPARRGVAWATRRAALAAPEVETLLSLRDYRADALATVALLDRAGDGTAAAARTALGRPRYALSIGRKACPLGLPPRASVVEAERLMPALARFDDDAPEVERDLRRGLRIDARSGAIHADLDFAETGRDLLRPDYRVLRIERRRDRIVSRRRWQFDRRAELVAVPAEAAA